jgi:hypothetical protein
MHTALASNALVGIEADPVDVILDEDRAKVVEPGIARVLNSVRLELTESAPPGIEHLVNSHTSQLRKRSSGPLERRRA